MQAEIKFGFFALLAVSIDVLLETSIARISFSSMFVSQEKAGSSSGQEGRSMFYNPRMPSSYNL
jgi:hypothetical protein